MSELYIPLTEQAEVVAASALAVPSTASEGADVSAWRKVHRQKKMRAIVHLYGTAATLTAVWLWGFRENSDGTSRWFRLGQLNGGNTIPIDSATQGYAEVIGFIGIFTRLAVSATGAAAVTQEFEPGEVT